MEGLVALGIVMAIVCVCNASSKSFGAVVVEDGQVGIGAITGGQFGPGSFSIGVPGSAYPSKRPENINSYDGDGGPLILKKTTHNVPPQRDNTGEPNHSGGTNWDYLQVQPHRAAAKQGHGGNGGEGGTGGGQIVIGTIIIPNKHKNKRKNLASSKVRQRGSSRASALAAIFTSDSENGYSSEETEHGNDGQGDGNIQIGSITGGSFAPGTSFTTSSNTRPTGALNNGNIENPNADNQAQYTIGQGANSNGGTGAGNGQKNPSHSNSGSYKDEDVWIWS